MKINLYIKCNFTFIKALLVIVSLLISFVNDAQEPSLVWMKTFGGGGDELIQKNITRTQDGGFIINIVTSAAANTGSIDSFCSFTNKRSIFIKYNSDASVIEWNKCFGFGADSNFNYIFPGSDGNFLLGGSFNGYVDNGWIVTKQDAVGNTLWQHNYGKGSGYILDDMLPMKDGTYILLGKNNRTDTNALTHYGAWDAMDFLVMKIDSNGNKMWSKVIGGTGDEQMGDLVAAPGNGFYIVGSSSSNDHDCTGNHGEYDVYVARLNDTGGIIWTNSLGGSSVDAAYNACSNGMGGVIITGFTKSTDFDVHHHGALNDVDFWTLEVDSSNTLVWENCHGTNSFWEKANSVCKASDGSIWISGYSFSNGDDVYIVHTDSVGNQLQSSVFGSNKTDGGSILHPLPSGMIFSGGYFSANNGAFSSTQNYGGYDVFISVFAPWGANIKYIYDNNFFKLYPNPVKNILNIELNNTHSDLVLFISDAIGRRLYSTQISSYTKEIGIDISNIPKGTFYVNIIDGNSNNYVKTVEIK